MGGGGGGFVCCLCSCCFLFCPNVIVKPLFTSSLCLNISWYRYRVFFLFICCCLFVVSVVAVFSKCCTQAFVYVKNVRYADLLGLNSNFRIRFRYHRGYNVLVSRAGWDSICTTFPWQSVCFKRSCLPYTAKCNSDITVRLADNAHAYCFALCLFDIFFITDRQRFI